MTHLSTMVEIAAELRQRAGQAKPPFSTRQIIEACFPTALVTGGCLPAGVDELVSVYSDGPVILYKRSLSGPEQRLAIGHALAHLIFDDERVCMRPGRAGVLANEERADAFAAELFAPLESIAGRVRRLPSEDLEEHEIYLDHVDEIASTFAVPAYVIDLQIHRLISVDTSANQKRLTVW